MFVMKIGRPKTFDDNEVLEQAMGVFWKFGYDKTSLDDLLKAMAIPRQSLYRTFGGKRALFLRALELYETRTNEIVLKTLQSDDSAITNIDNVFQVWTDRLTSPDRNGCLIQNTCGQSIFADKEIAAIVLNFQSRVFYSFEQALKQGQREGDVNSAVNAKAVAHTVTSSLNGLLSLSRVGLPNDVVKNVFDTLRSLILAK